MTREIRESFVVVADDYGIRQTAEPILRLAHEGKVDRVAVLIHYVSAEQAEELKATGVKIDLHLELIGLLKRGEKAHENSFLRSVNFFFRYFFGLATVKKVEEEWRNQIHLFQELFGRLPDGFNSHEYLHYFPPFFQVFTRLAKANGISYVRFGKNGMLTGPHKTFTSAILSYFWKQTRGAYSKTNLATSDYLVSLDWFSDFKTFNEQLPKGSIELVVHLEREEDYRTILEYF